ncbi:MAG TPA: glycosyl transferase family 1 [Planctomycetaceae bacterium]|nr:glycosyl transferase family 1 [Planctomycetaceae bacterium]
MRVTICAYDNSVGIGGPYVWMQRMPLELRQRGFDVRVRLFHWGRPEEGVLFRALQRQDFAVASQPFGSSEANVRWLLEELVDDPPDVLIADNVIPGLLAGRYLRQSGIPTIGILRSDDSFYHGIIDRFVAGDQPDQLSAVVSVSQFLTDTVRENRIGALITETIPSGTPIPDQVATSPQDVLRLVYVGRLVQEQKRIIETVDALIRVVTEIEDVHVTIFGDGPERSRVEELIVPYAAKLSLAGSVSSEELQTQLLQSHAIALLSDYEGTPTAVMEAMACGVVPVCLRIRSGIPDLVRDGKTGILVDDRGLAFVAAVRKLKSDKAFWKTLSASARQHVEQHYSISSCADRWADLLRRITVNHNQQPQLFLPHRLKLAPLHVGYAHQDVREPGIVSRTHTCLRHGYHRLRKYLGHARRVIFRAPIA